MRYFFIIITAIITFHGSAQRLSADEFDNLAKTNIRLQPKYGNARKSREQLKADQKFIAETMRIEKFKGNKTAASNHMIELGFNYLYNGDIKTAMYRFNQAYLLDKTNTDIYWGFGAVYMVLGKTEKAHKMYAEGLAANPNNTHLLTDSATGYLVLASKEPNAKNAETLANKALQLFLKSYKIDSHDQNTLYKLSAFYLNKKDCNNARRYYKKCKALGGKPITAEYTAAISKLCK